MKKKFYIVPVTEQMVVNTSEMMELDHQSKVDQGTGSSTSTNPSAPDDAPIRKVF